MPLFLLIVLRTRPSGRCLSPDGERNDACKNSDLWAEGDTAVAFPDGSEPFRAGREPGCAGVLAIMATVSAVSLWLADPDLFEERKRPADKPLSLTYWLNWHSRAVSTCTISPVG
jgi:hypothetical protein